jgi:hypothetical protein
MLVPQAAKAMHQTTQAKQGCHQHGQQGSQQSTQQEEQRHSRGCWRQLDICLAVSDNREGIDSVV